MVRVDNYTSTLAMPYEKAQASLWSYFNSVQDTVNSSTQNGATADTLATIGEVFASILEVAPVFGEAAQKIAAAIISAYHLALSLSNVGHAEDEPFSTQAANLAAGLTDRLNTTSTEIQALAQHHRGGLRKAGDGGALYPGHGEQLPEEHR